MMSFDFQLCDVTSGNVLEIGRWFLCEQKELGEGDGEVGGFN